MILQVVVYFEFQIAKKLKKNETGITIVRMGQHAERG